MKLWLIIILLGLILVGLALLGQSNLSLIERVEALQQTQTFLDTPLPSLESSSSVHMDYKDGYDDLFDRMEGIIRSVRQHHTLKQTESEQRKMDLLERLNESMKIVANLEKELALRTASLEEERIQRSIDSKDLAYYRNKVIHLKNIINE